MPKANAVSLTDEQRQELKRISRSGGFGAKNCSSPNPAQERYRRDR